MASKPLVQLFQEEMWRDNKMKVTREYLCEVRDHAISAEVKPLPVYIVNIGSRNFMVPVSSMPEELAPAPCEVVGVKFPVGIPTPVFDEKGPYTLDMGYRPSGGSKSREN